MALEVAGSVQAESPLGIFLSVSPPLSAILCFVLPGISAARIYRSRATLQLPLTPFLSMAAQSMVWLAYGVLVQSATVVVPNVVGSLLGSVYTWIYLQATPPDKRRALCKQFAVAGGVLALVGLVLLLGSDAQALAFVGLTGASGSVLFAASPLVAIVTVLQQRSVDAMPLHTSLILFANGALWSGFGFLVRNDPTIYVPNVLGLSAGSLQLAVHAYMCAAAQPAPPKYSSVPQEEEGPGAADKV